MRTHTGKKLYKCTWEECDCAFNPGESPASSAETAEQSSSKGKEKDKVNYHAVKMKLNSFCKSAAMQEELDDIALWITRTVIETSRFLVL